LSYSRRTWTRPSRPKIVSSKGCRGITIATNPSPDAATAIVLAYVLVSMGVIIAFLLAASMIGRFSGWLRQHRREQRGEE